VVLLRAYQLEALDKWYSNNRKGIVVLPTGTGKTFIGLKLIEDYYRQGLWTLVVVPTEVILRHWLRKILDYTGVKPEHIGVLNGRRREFRPVTVAIINTAVKFIPELLTKYKLHIYDEVHHYFAPKWRQLFFKACQHCDVIGLTATLKRQDQLHTLSPIPVVYSKSAVEMYDGKVIAKPRIYIVDVKLTEDEWDYITQLDMQIKDVALKIRELEYYNVTGIYVQEYQMLRDKLMSLVTRRRQFLSSIRNKLIACCKLVEKHRENKILIFTESIDTCNKVTKVLAKRGFKVASIHSNVKNRDAILRDFKSGRINILVACHVLDEGFDVPDVDVAIIMGGTLSPRQWVQRIGRVVRQAPNKQPIVYILRAKLKEWKLLKVLAEALKGEKY